MTEHLRLLGASLFAIMMASAALAATAPAAEFKTESTPTTLTSEAASALRFVYGTDEVVCENLTSTTIVEEESAAEIQAGSVQIDNCIVQIGETKLTLHTPFNDCSFGFTVGEEIEEPGHKFSGTGHFICPEGSKGIEANVTFLGTRECAKIPPQTSTDATVDYTNEGEGSTRAIRGMSTIQGITYTKVGICGEGTFNDGLIEGELEITGETEVQEHSGFWIE